MNILNRRMFAAGDVVNQPLIDVTTEIANLSRSGLAPVQILEKLQSDYVSMGVPFPKDLGLATIERIAIEVGGPMTIVNQSPNMATISTDANTLQNIVPPVTDGFFTPDKTIPNLPTPDFSEDIEAVMPDREVAVCREMTKAFEEVLVGAPSELIGTLDANASARGEIVVLIHPPAAREKMSELEVRKNLGVAMQSQPLKTAAARVAALSGWSKRDVYQLALTFSDDENE